MKKSDGNIYADEAQELERRRFRAVQKVVDGATQTSVAKEFNVALSAVNQWMGAGPFCQDRIIFSLRCSRGYAAKLCSSLLEKDSYITSGVR